MKKLLPLLLFYVNVAVAQNCVPNTNSISFDGFSSYISMPSSSALNITDSITIEAWIYSNSWGFTSAQNSIVCKHGWYFGEEGYVLRAGGTGELSWNIAGQDVIIGWHDVISSTGALQLNTWYHVAGTFDGTSLKIYINGSLAGTTAFTGTIVSSVNHSMNIGRLADMNQPETRYWSGMIDEVRIWHRALDSTELAANMNKHIEPFTSIGLVGYWRLNDGTGSSVLDLSASANTGQLNNGTWSTVVPFTGGPPTPVITPSGSFLLSSAPLNNQWNLNGIPLPGETNASYIPLQDGSYTVTVTDAAGCSATSAPHIINDIDSPEKNSPIVVRNLPGKILYFVASTEVLRKAEINLVDINGRIVAKKSKGSIDETMDVKSIFSGIYFLVMNIDGAEYKSKVVLN